MEILWWLAPAAVVTLVAMLWVGWIGRTRAGGVDRAAAARRLGEALERGGRRPRYVATSRRPERSTGVASRRPVPRPVSAPRPEQPAAPARTPVETDGDGPQRRDGEQRRAS